MKPLIVPDPEKISVINVRLSNSYDVETDEHIGSVTIVEEKKIAEVVGYIKKINKNMRGAMFTFPTPTHKVIFEDDEGLNLLVFIGANWIGGRNNIDGEASANRLTTIDETTRAEFLALLGVGMKNGDE